jgi:GABA permease
MRRYLIVANRTLAGGHLVAKVRELMQAGPCTFHVLVPATAPTDHPWTEGETLGAARARLDAALARLHDLGIEVAGEIGDARPVQAVADLLERGERFDEIVVSTLPPGPSRWLKVDLPHRIQAQFGIPVVHVIGQPEPAGATSA